MKNELLVKTLGDLDFLVADLKELNSECGLIESLVIGPMIGRAAELRAELRRFAEAAESEGGA